MYKFEITGKTIEELNDNMNQFFSEFKVSKVLIDAESEYWKKDLDTEAEEVVDSIQHATTATVPHLHQNHFPSPTLEPTPVVRTFATEQNALNNKDELDKRGMPWDVRIHSAGRSLNQDGTWRNRRGVDPTLLAQVEKEISQINPAPSFSAPPIPPVPFSPTPAAMPQFSAPQTMAPNAGQPQQPQYSPPHVEPIQYQQIAPTPVQPPVQNVAPVLNVPDQTQIYNNVAIPAGTKPAHTLHSFTNAIPETFAQLVSDKKIDQKYIQSLCEHFQVKNIWNVTASGVKTRELYDSMGEYGLITKLD